MLKVGDLVYIIGPPKECLCGNKSCSGDRGDLCNNCPGFITAMFNCIGNITKIINIDCYNSLKLDIKVNKDLKNNLSWLKDWVIKLN